MKFKIKVLNTNYKDLNTNYTILKVRVLKCDNRFIKINYTSLKGTIIQNISKNDILDITGEYDKNNDCIYLQEIENKKDDINNQLINFFVEHTSRISKDTFSKIFNEHSLNEIELNIDILNKYKFTDKKKQNFKAALAEFRKYEIMGALALISGISMEQSLLIWEKYKSSSLETIKTNPFKLYYSGICTFKESSKLYEDSYCK